LRCCTPGQCWGQGGLPRLLLSGACPHLLLLLPLLLLPLLLLPLLLLPLLWEMVSVTAAAAAMAAATAAVREVATLAVIMPRHLGGTCPHLLQQ
jgi:hypothetical protein